MDEVVVTGSRSNARGYYVDGVREKKTRAQVPLAIQRSRTQRLFAIENTYTLLHNKPPQNIHLLTHYIDQDYHYEIVSKIEEKAYLVATIEEWRQYDLLPGTINIYMNAIYQGSHNLDNNSEKDLKLSIGIDDQIAVERKQIADWYEAAVSR